MSSQLTLKADRKRPRAETDSRGSDPVPQAASSSSKPAASSVRSPDRKRLKESQGKGKAPARQVAQPVLAPAKLRAPPIKRKTTKATYVPSDSDGDPSSNTHAHDDAAETSSSDNDNDNLVSALSARTKAAALMAGMPAPPGSRRALFLVKYSEHTPEKALELQSARWTSNHYKHFHTPIIIEGPNGTIIYRFKCRKHPSKHVDRLAWAESTGNLARHVKQCDLSASPEAELITSYASGATYSPARMRFLLAMWVARRHRPFMIVEDPKFHEICRMLYAKAQVPSRVTLSRDVQAIFAEVKGRLIDYLQILAITCDNAENNTTMMEELELLIPGFRGSATRAIMSQFDRERAKRKGGTNVPEDPDLIALDDAPGTVVDEPAPVHEEDLEAAEEADPEREASDDKRIDEIDEMEEDHPELVLTPADVRLARLALEKITKVSQLLHPAHKTHYFDREKWPREWKREALRLCREEWQAHYRPAQLRGAVEDAPGPSRQHALPKPGPGRRSAQRSASAVSTAKRSANTISDKTRALFASVGGSGTGGGQAEKDALEAYLEASPLKTIKDPLAYWNSALESDSVDPSLARMALDFLSIPAEEEEEESYAFDGDHFSSPGLSGNDD
ncbi:hypothetical protein LXA43DRAFT_1068490 [Ganoderma leucocontextum]|nr:hypothetical protein LXA43DRAFT_1068490 [Ganoderma leucocontextum]